MSCHREAKGRGDPARRVFGARFLLSLDCHVATLLAMTDERGLAMTAGPWRLMGRGGLGVELDAQGGGDFEDGGETGVALS